MIAIAGCIVVLCGLSAWLARIWRQIPNCNEDFVLY